MFESRRARDSFFRQVQSRNVDRPFERHRCVNHADGIGDEDRRADNLQRRLEVEQHQTAAEPASASTHSATGAFLEGEQFIGVCIR